MARVTFGKSRVRESRMLGSVRAKPNGLSYSTINFYAAYRSNACTFEAPCPMLAANHKRC